MDDVVLAGVGADLDLDHLEVDLARVGEAVCIVGVNRPTRFFTAFERSHEVTSTVSSAAATTTSSSLTTVVSLPSECTRLRRKPGSQERGWPELAHQQRLSAFGIVGRHRHSDPMVLDFALDPIRWGGRAR